MKIAWLIYAASAVAAIIVLIVNFSAGMQQPGQTGAVSAVLGFIGWTVLNAIFLLVLMLVTASRHRADQAAKSTCPSCRWRGVWGNACPHCGREVLRDAAGYPVWQ